jgi:hypothetical protein
MLEYPPISNFNSLLELFVVFNLTYVSVKGVKEFVNCKVFGLGDRQNVLNSKIELMIEDITTRQLNIEPVENEDIQVTSSRYILAKKDLLSLREKIPENIQKIQTFFRYIYLLGTFFTITLLTLGGVEKFPDTSILIKSLSVFTVIILIGFSVLGFSLKIPENCMLRTLLVFILIFIISLVLVMFEIKVFDFFPNFCSILIPTVPFIINYLGTILLYRKLKLGFKDIQEAVNEPYNHNRFSKRLDNFLKTISKPPS